MSGSNRLSNIKTLKERVMDLQKQLTHLQKIEEKLVSPGRQQQRSVTKRYHTQAEMSPVAHKASPCGTPKSPQGGIKSPYGTPKNSKSFKNPTFWGDNPILGVEATVRSPKKSTSPLRKSIKPSESIKQLMYMTQKDFRSDVQLRFNQTCQNLKLSVTPSKQSLIKTTSKESLNPELKKSVRLPIDLIPSCHQKKQTKQNQQTPRFKRASIKVFSKKPVDPILRPPIQKKTCRKVNPGRNQSPLNMLTEHDRSDIHMYLSPTKTPIYLTPQNVTSRKNRSEIMKELLNYTSNDSNQRSPSKGKKHYSRHFNETISSTIFF